MHKAVHGITIITALKTKTKQKPGMDYDVNGNMCMKQY